MRILLDENFPIQLYRRLQQLGHDAEHVIALGLRGLPDACIRRRLAVEADLVFLTQDTEFAELPDATAATVMISRVPQAIPIAERVEVWVNAIGGFLGSPGVGPRRTIPGRLFEVLADGRVVAWRTEDLRRAEDL